MADVKVSALGAASVSTDGSEHLYVVQGGTSKKMTLDQIDEYVGPIRNAATAGQTLGTGDTYVTASRLVLPQARMQAGTVYRARLTVTKTAAGTATPVFQVRAGTAGSTADTSMLSYTGVAQTAAVDTGYIEVQATFRVVGASAVLASTIRFTHDLASTGLANAQRNFQGQAVSSTFNSTTASMGIGLSINAGASSAWTVQQCYAELVNLT
jgi:hypothetical protein